MFFFFFFQTHQLERANNKLRLAKEEFVSAIESVSAFLKDEEHEETTGAVDIDDRKIMDLGEELHQKISTLGDKKFDVDEELEVTKSEFEGRTLELKNRYENQLFV